MDITASSMTREQVTHALYEAAELEHNLMCTYLYAAFSLKDGEDEGLSPQEAEAISRWRSTILSVAVDEMSHLVAVWNITAAIGATPRFGRTNFPLDPGLLPAGIVVKLAPFSQEVLQHFVYLERPTHSSEREGEGFAPQQSFLRSPQSPRVTPMGMDYDTVGEFYHNLQAAIARLAEDLGESTLFCGDPSLQLCESDIALPGARTVLCAKTAVAAFDAIVKQGEGAQEENSDSHYCRFLAMRDELRALKRNNPNFEPAHPAACNPVLRRPPKPEGRVFIEDDESSAIVDVANASYQTMLRLLAYTYTLRSGAASKTLSVNIAIALMKAFTWLAESAARRPSGPANPGVNAGVSFTALRDSAPLMSGASGGTFLSERVRQLAGAASTLDTSEPRVQRAAALLSTLSGRVDDLARAPTRAIDATPHHSPKALPVLPPSVVADGVEIVQGEKLELRFNGKLCIHARLCVTQAPAVFLADVKGPWLYPDAMDVEELAAISRACPSGAIQYTRKDGGAEDHAPPVNLISVRESGPYAVRAELLLDGKNIGTRATLCRCGASKNKPYCDGSHGPAGFVATGEPATGTQTTMLVDRGGPLHVAPQTDGPLTVSGNLEVLSGTGRMVARLQSAKLCRCGQSGTKPYCDGTHRVVGFRST
jgi:CDGSH-type Zn-finger protein/uncharacterized Fe-S cluster protein YjdI